MTPQKVLRGVLAVAFFLLSLQAVAFLARTLFVEEGVCNEQGPFGLAAPAFALFAAFSVATLFFVWQWWKEEDERQGLLWLLLLSAGVSNALERLVHGCIFDFLALPSFPLFNAADVVLSLSVVFLLSTSLKSHR